MSGHPTDQFRPVPGQKNCRAALEGANPAKGLRRVSYRTANTRVGPQTVRASMTGDNSNSGKRKAPARTEALTKVSCDVVDTRTYLRAQ